MMMIRYCFLLGRKEWLLLGAFGPCLAVKRIENSGRMREEIMLSYDYKRWDFRTFARRTAIL